jgi:hypothetical protein
VSDQAAAVLDPRKGESFVGSSHGDLDAVRELLAEEPALVNASWDWGAGDWETGLGAAAHMGRRDIAPSLIEHGARLDLFAAAMLSDVEVVRATLEAYPPMRDAPGPHGISLLEHVRAGGDDAREVLELLGSSEVRG